MFQDFIYLYLSKHTTKLFKIPFYFNQAEQRVVVFCKKLNQSKKYPFHEEGISELLFSRENLRKLCHPVTKILVIRSCKYSLSRSIFIIIIIISYFPTFTLFMNVRIFSSTNVKMFHVQ